jgi:hypothetical protein
MKTKALTKKVARVWQFQPVPISKLVEGPLKELFWGLPESSLANEAQQRIEAMLLRAAATVPAPAIVREDELPVAA